MNTNRALIVNHIQENKTIYVFMIILFLTGVSFGAIIVNSMNFVQKQDLVFYIERYFGQIVQDQQIASSVIFKNSLFYRIKYLLLLFVLGLSVIVLPVIWILLFVKGLVVGFSVGFIVNQLGFKRLILASLSIAPQNLIIIPIYIIASSLSMIFSLILLGKLFTRRISQPVLHPLRKYIFLYALLIGASLLAASLESFVVYESMQAVINNFHK